MTSIPFVLDDPTLLPEVIRVPRVASALWWPTRATLRVSSRTFDRQAACDALKQKIAWEGTLLWVVEDKPYVVPPLVAAWSRAGSTQRRHDKTSTSWGLSTFRPQLRINDNVWTWRRCSIEHVRWQSGNETDDAMNVEGDAWARNQRLAWIPEISAGQVVTEMQLTLARYARGIL